MASYFISSPNFLIILVIFTLDIFQIRGVPCYICNPTLDYVPLISGSVSLDDILDTELIPFTKDKSLCKDFATDQKSNPKFTAECPHGCATGTVTSTKYKVHLSLTQSLEDVTTSTRVISLVDGPFKACFHPGEMVLEKCMDHAKINKTGANTMNSGTSLSVTTHREYGTINVCGCGGEFCNGGGGVGLGASSKPNGSASPLIPKVGVVVELIWAGMVVVVVLFNC